jgi:outer membrane lipoprotein-sorting protein
MRQSGFNCMAALALVSAPAVATADPSGFDIMNNVENRKDGKDQKATITLEIKPENGTPRLRKFTFLRKTYDDHRKYVTYFVAPADVRNSAFLEWDMQKGETDRRWLYLPAIAQVRRLTTGDERNAFFGSDFVYEDVTNRDPELDEHKVVGSEKIKSWDCWVIESMPKEKRKVEFAKYKTWVWKDDAIIVKQDFYDEGGKMFKSFEMASLKQVDGIWSWHQAVMTNMKTKSRSRVQLSDIKYNTDIADESFTERQLTRGAP